MRTLATGATALSSDAALSALSLISVELEQDFSSTAYSYTVSVATDVTQTTVTATLNDTAASYVVKLGGAVAEDDVMDLTPGRNVITVHVTAEDGVTTRVYTVVVTRAKVAEGTVHGYNAEIALPQRHRHRHIRSGYDHVHCPGY